MTLLLKSIIVGGSVQTDTTGASCFSAIFEGIITISSFNIQSRILSRVVAFDDIAQLIIIPTQLLQPSINLSFIRPVCLGNALELFLLYHAAEGPVTIQCRLQQPICILMYLLPQLEHFRSPSLGLFFPFHQGQAFGLQSGETAIDCLRIRSSNLRESSSSTLTDRFREITREK